MKVERHADRFAPDCPDEDWLREIGQKGWIAVTHDGRIRYKPNELAAVMQRRVAFLVVIGHAPYPERAKAFVARFPRIQAFTQAHQPPYIAKVYRPTVSEIADDPPAAGRMELWHPRPALPPNTPRSA